MTKKTEFVKTAATAVAEKSLEKAKKATGWKKVLWGIATAAAAALAWLCGNATQQQPDITPGEPVICVPEGVADPVAE